ncbi:zinc finger protein 830-like isoform X3 [Centruroides sculpturatus]|uniref:zinc finger protein 830-like isoform X3 n=1 Tax=Centruroides sculpturatus TaxID=218467 RepID=UPI000C6C8FFB|nr:zinc finger protein 830-like isoform X3 [Centruroides sculpturatus]
MATSTKKSSTQSDLRKLMKERRSELITKGKQRIDSPLAKYNSTGQLTCIVCDVSLKSEALWSVHITGKTHKEKLEALKRRQINTEKPLKPEIKRKHEDTQIEEDEIKDFFDDATKEQITPSTMTKEVERLKSNELPEGFFDNPILDAKVRKVEYKDPMEEEWEKFKKIMAEESNLSQAIIEEDMQESNVEREITEIDEQIHRWSRVEALQERKEELMKSKSGEEEEREEEEGSADDGEFEEFLDWRSKRLYKK